MSNILLLICRTVTFFGLAAYMFFMPCYRHFFDDTPGFGKWRMYMDRPPRTQLLRFAVTKNGRMNIIDRTSPHAAGAAHIRDVDPALAYAKGLCLRTGEGAAIRVYLAQPTDRGWKWLIRGESDVCTDV